MTDLQQDYVVSVIVFGLSAIGLITALLEGTAPLDVVSSRTRRRPSRRARRPKPEPRADNVVDFRKYKRRASMKTGGNPATA